MEFEITRCAKVVSIPPRCRKPRTTYEDKMFKMNIQEMTEESFPLACTVTHGGKFFERKLPDIEFRCDGTKFFTQYRWPGTLRPEDRPTAIDDEAELQRQLGYDLEHGEPEEIIQLDIENKSKKYRVFDGTLWFETKEPFYFVNINHHGIVFIDICILNTVEAQTKASTVNGFRADEREDMKAFVEGYFQSVKDTIPDDMFEENYRYAMEAVEKNEIKTTHAFVSTLGTQKERLRIRLRNHIKGKVGEIFGEKYSWGMYLPKDERGQKTIELLKERLEASIRENPEFVEKEHIMTDEMFFQAFTEILSQLLVPEENEAKDQT